MDINITQWALDSYLDLRRQKVFTDQEYRQTIRPDALRLLTYPTDTKFTNNKFWSQATEGGGLVISDGYKMKWHQIGDGRIQLRLTVGLIGNEFYLCEAYVKKDEKIDKRMLAKFKVYLQLIRMGRFQTRGKLS
jgi:hypothetical protein